MNPTTGKTSGRPHCDLIGRGPSIVERASKGKHCPHADRIRLRRVPKWLEVNRDDGYGKLIPITQLFKRRMRAWLKRTSR